jgi:hypothetical protein
MITIRMYMAKNVVAARFMVPSFRDRRPPTCPRETRLRHGDRRFPTKLRFPSRGKTFPVGDIENVRSVAFRRRCSKRAGLEHMKRA